VIVPGEQLDRLNAMFEAAGANVLIYWRDGRHELGSDDLQTANMWTAQQRFVPDIQSTKHIDSTLR
jgi:predicted esterase